MAIDLDDPTLLEQVEFVDERERVLFAQAHLGYQVRAFLVGPAGMYLHGRAKQELEEVKNELLDLGCPSWHSPLKRRKWRELHFRAEVARRFITWCADVLTEGSQAENQLESEYEQQ